MKNIIVILRYGRKIFDFHQQAKTPPFTALSEAKAALSLYQEEQAASRKSNLRGRKLFIQQSFFAYLFPNAKETIDGNSSDFINHLVIENKELKQWLVHFLKVDTNIPIIWHLKIMRFDGAVSDCV